MADNVLGRLLTRATSRIYALPVVVLMPHSRCNCRCVMCDIWRANAAKQELAVEDLAHHAEAFRRLGVRWAILSGGEALMHGNLWALCDLLNGLGIAVTLLSTGLLLERYATQVVAHCRDVIVSLDGSRDVHDAIRRVPRAYDRLAAGVAALRAAAPGYRVTARSTVQRANYRDLPKIVDAAHELGLDLVSFLAADVSTTAFNRPTPWDAERAGGVALGEDDLPVFRQVLDELFTSHAVDFASGFIAEPPARLIRLHRYFAALLGHGDFPETVCNAPWVSSVVEADGTVRPCFFHRPFGNLHDQPLEAILNSPEAVAFRRRLDVKRDPICRKCVCTLSLGLTAAV